MAADPLDKVADLAVARQRAREQAKVAEDATHDELARAWMERAAVGAHQPVYTAGALWVPTEPGLWRETSLERVQVEVARAFGYAKRCKKGGDYAAIARHITALAELEDFFDAAPLGVVSAAGFHRLTPAGHVELEPLTLDHRQTFALSYAPDREADTPLLDGLLNAAFDGDDPAAQKALWWQAVGAAIFGVLAQYQLALLLFGKANSGKSLLQRVLEHAFPRDVVAAVSPASWGHEYHVAALAGKRLNLVGELDDAEPVPAAAFKNVTGEGLVSARHPTHRPFSFRCRAAHVFASNVLPPCLDRTEGFYRRWRVLRFSNAVPPERTDPHLLAKIVAAELPGFLARAIEGVEAVQRAGRVMTTTPHDDVMLRWRLAGNPIEQFLLDREWVELDRDADPPPARPTMGGRKPEVYASYRRWASVAGFRNPFGRNHFVELLQSTGPRYGVDVKRVQSVEVVVGLRLVPRRDIVG